MRRPWRTRSRRDLFHYSAAIRQSLWLRLEGKNFALTAPLPKIIAEGEVLTDRRLQLNRRRSDREPTSAGGPSRLEGARTSRGHRASAIMSQCMSLFMAHLSRADLAPPCPLLGV